VALRTLKFPLYVVPLRGLSGSEGGSLLPESNHPTRGESRPVLFEHVPQMATFSGGAGVESPNLALRQKARLDDPQGRFHPGIRREPYLRASLGYSPFLQLSDQLPVRQCLPKWLWDLNRKLHQRLCSKECCRHKLMCPRLKLRQRQLLCQI
jgi:hypothetical protein